MPFRVIQTVCPHFIAQNHARCRAESRKGGNKHLLYNLCCGNRRHGDNAHSAVDEGVHGNAQSPNGFVENHRRSNFKELTDKSFVKPNQFPQFRRTCALRSVNIYENCGAFVNSRNQCADRRAAQSHLRKAEFAENQCVVDKCVHGNRRGGNHDGKRNLVDCAVKIGVALGNRLKRIGKRNQGEIPRAEGNRAFLGGKNPHDMSRECRTANCKNECGGNADAQRKSQHTAYIRHVFFTPILRGQYGRTACHAEQYQRKHEKHFIGKSDGGKGFLA